MKNIEAEKTGSSEKNPDNKKREDLTSLGSDYSGNYYLQYIQI